MKTTTKVKNKLINQNKNIFMKRLGKIQVLVLAAIALFSSCGGENKEDNTVDSAEGKPIVKLALVTTQPVNQTESFTATVEADVKNNIAPSMPVRIDKIFVEVGDQVRKGQKLVQMDNANLLQSQTQLENLKVEFNRVDELYKVGGVSKSEWDARKVSLDVAQTAFDNLSENTTLTSPINGVVTARNYDNGDMYSGAMPVLTVEQISPVKLVVNVSEGYFKDVKKGMTAKINLDVYGNEEFTGKVNLIYPTIDATTRTFPVEIILDNRDQRVRPGMFARVMLSFGVLDNVVVPDQAIVKQVGSGERFVYVYENGKVYYRKVELGRRLSTEYELISGVENGAQVVVAGQVRLSDGAEVDVEK